MVRLLIILLLAPFFSKSQNIEKAIGDAVDIKIKTFADRLEKIYVDTITRIGSFNMDTVTVPVGKAKVYTLSLNGYQNGKSVTLVQDVTVVNRAGVYAAPTLNRSQLMEIAGVTVSYFVLTTVGVIVRIVVDPLKNKNPIFWELRKISI